MPRLERNRVLSGAAFLLALLALVTAALAADLRCATCGKPIKGRYVQVGNKAYCSRKCHEASLPVCATCGTRIAGRHLKQGGKCYCSQRCLEAILPKCEICGKAVREYVTIKGHVYCRQHGDGPRCDACGLPVAKGSELADKRLLCERCIGQVVLEEEDAQAIYRRARREVESFLGYAFDEVPTLRLVGRDQMPASRRGVPLADVQERGYYLYQEQVDTYKDGNGRVLRTERQVTETVSILYGLTPAELLCTAGHELAHAFQARSLPDIHFKGPDWLKEGVCQYVAAAIARRRHYHDELTSIERSPHPAYGRGYRYLVKQFGKNNWKGLHAWLRTLDPAALPRVLPEDL